MTDLKVNKYSIFYMLVFIPFLTPAEAYMPHTLVVIIKLLKIGISALFIIQCINRKMWRKPHVLLFLCAGTILFSTVINDGVIFNQIYRTISIIGFISLCTYGLNTKPKQFMRGVLIYSVPLIILTCFTMFYYYRPGEYEGGMRVAGDYLEYGRRISGNWYLLGIDNSAFFQIFPVLILLIVYDKVYKGGISLFTGIMYTLVSISYIYVRSATAIVCFIGGAILILVCEAKSFERLKDLIIYKWVGLIPFIFAVLIVWQRKQYIFQGIITGLFKKSLTLTRRTEIWDTALDLIRNNLLLGYGRQSDAYNFALFRVNHVHNIILELLYDGGIIAAILFFAAFICFGSKVKRYKESSCAAIIIGAIAIYLLNSCLDFYFHLYIPYMLFVLIYSIDILHKEGQRGGAG